MQAWKYITTAVSNPARSDRLSCEEVVAAVSPKALDPPKKQTSDIRTSENWGKKQGTRDDERASQIEIWGKYFLKFSHSIFCAFKNFASFQNLPSFAFQKIGKILPKPPDFRNPDFCIKTLKREARLAFETLPLKPSSPFLIFAFDSSRRSIESKIAFETNKYSMEVDRVCSRDCAIRSPGRQGAALDGDLHEIEVKNGVQKESSKRRTTVCPPTQEDDDDDFVDPPLRQLRMRFPTKRLTDFISGLNNTKKACVNSIGFGSVLKLKIDSFSKSLAFWVIDNYNPDTNSICFYNKTITVTKERVNQIYGIPIGEEEMNQFPTSLKRPRLTHILQKLEKSKKADDLFVVNFLVLFMNVMVQSIPMGDVNKIFLKYIPNIESVKDLDWCGLVMTSLKASKKLWAPNDNKSFYTGSALFLILLYLQYTNINNEAVNIPRPSIAYWTEKLLSDQESKELEMGGYGNATIRTNDLIASSSRQVQGTDEAVLEGNESEAGDIDEQARKLEEILWEIDFNFKEVAKEKKNLKKLLESGVKEYPESNELKECMAKHISEFGRDKRPEGDNEADEGDKTPIHNPSHTSVTTPVGQDSIQKENIGDKGKQIINEGCLEGVEEGDEDDSGPSMTQLLTPAVFDNLVADALAKRSGSISLQLGLKTPEVVQLMQDDSDVNDDDIIDVMPLRYVPLANTKRKLKPTAKAKSPYVKRVVDSCAQMQDIEMQLIFLLNFNRDVIYRNKFNDSVFKGVFESMIPGSCVHATAIDIWALQLSYTEQFRSRTSPIRLFMPSTILSNMVFDERYTKDERYKVFKTRMNQHLEKYQEFCCFCESQLVFFPVLKSEHFYLIVFNLKRIECAVIDNSWVDVPMDAKYGSVPDDMVDFFTRYLTTAKHPKTNKFKHVNLCRFFMSWMTKNNKVDCGVFVMRHMETYKGEKMEKWDASLESECDSLKEQLNELRWKYVTKMLLSDMNLLNDYVEGKRDSYVNIPEAKRKKYGKKAHLEKIELRLKTISVWVDNYLDTAFIEAKLPNGSSMFVTSRSTQHSTIPYISRTIEFNSSPPPNILLRFARLLGFVCVTTSNNQRVNTYFLGNSSMPKIRNTYSDAAATRMQRLGCSESDDAATRISYDCADAAMNPNQI
ncbi:hypothetical protein LXL04_020384 [Taraxacum kok-saghyz]